MAEMINADQLKEFKRQYPNSVVVCYVNSTVEVKAESDICCTSSNAVQVVSSIPKDKRFSLSQIKTSVLGYKNKQEETSLLGTDTVLRINGDSIWKTSQS
jgi:quinolinate synthase